MLFQKIIHFMSRFGPIFSGIFNNYYFSFPTLHNIHHCNQFDNSQYDRVPIAAELNNDSDIIT